MNETLKISLIALLIIITIFLLKGASYRINLLHRNRKIKQPLLSRLASVLLIVLITGIFSALMIGLIYIGFLLSTLEIELLLFYYGARVLGYLLMGVAGLALLGCILCVILAAYMFLVIPDVKKDKSENENNASNTVYIDNNNEEWKEV